MIFTKSYGNTVLLILIFLLYDCSSDEKNNEKVVPTITYDQLSDVERIDLKILELEETACELCKKASMVVEQLAKYKKNYYLEDAEEYYYSLIEENLNDYCKSSRCFSSGWSSYGSTNYYLDSFTGRSRNNQGYRVSAISKEIRRLIRNNQYSSSDVFLEKTVINKKIKLIQKYLVRASQLQQVYVKVYNGIVDISTLIQDAKSDVEMAKSFGDEEIIQRLDKLINSPGSFEELYETPDVNEEELSVILDKIMNEEI
ncbi:MAG: hypothetical protein AAFY76_00750 [Cyanobacteria bacterium J06649_11]